MQTDGCVVSYWVSTVTLMANRGYWKHAFMAIFKYYMSRKYVSAV